MGTVGAEPVQPRGPAAATQRDDVAVGQGRGGGEAARRADAGDHARTRIALPRCDRGQIDRHEAGRRLAPAALHPLVDEGDLPALDDSPAGEVLPAHRPRDADHPVR